MLASILSAMVGESLCSVDLKAMMGREIKDRIPSSPMVVIICMISELEVAGRIFQKIVEFKKIGFTLL